VSDEVTDALHVCTAPLKAKEKRRSATGDKQSEFRDRLSEGDERPERGRGDPEKGARSARVKRKR
jgi:hypothetical protein